MKSIQAQGTSMLPAILPGARLEVEEVSPSKIVAGDIICYLNPGKNLIAHRVVEVCVRKGVTTFIVRGDSQSVTETVDPSAVAMIVRRVVGDHLSYRTGGPVGRSFRMLAMGGGLPWRVARRGMIAGASRLSRLKTLFSKS